MHTPNKGLTYMFKISSVLITCFYKSVPFPPFPSRFPFPLFPSLVPFQKQSVVFVTYTSPLLSKSVHSLPSSSLPTVPFPLSLLTIIFPSLFPIDDHVPTLLSYFRLCSHSLSLFLIMPWHSLSWCPYVTFARLLWMQFLCIKCLSVRTGQLLLCTKLYSESATLFSAGVPSWNNECSRPLKNGCSSPPK